MPNRPIIKRWKKRECLLCGRKLNNNILRSSIYPGISYPGDEFWCQGCADRARFRGIRNARPPVLTQEYIDAVLEAYDNDDPEQEA